MKRKEIPPPPNPHHRDVMSTRHGEIVFGAEVSIEGLKGRFRFLYGWDDNGATFWGPIGGQTAKMRTFAIPQITKIHKKKVTKNDVQG